MLTVVLGLMARKHNLYTLRHLLLTYTHVDVVTCPVEFKYMYVRLIITKSWFFSLIKIDPLILSPCILLHKIKASDLYEMQKGSDLRLVFFISVFFLNKARVHHYAQAHLK